MKNLCGIAFLLLTCCQTETKEAEVFPVVHYEDNSWITYEGIIPTESGEELTMTLSLLSGAPGMESDYRLEEWSRANNMYLMGRSSSNKFTTFVGNNADEVIVKLHDSRINRQLFYGNESSEASEQLRKSNSSKTDLFFKTKGNELILTDYNFREIDAKRYSLVRRSKTFTVEGYITFVNDTSDFFEMNTRESWALSDRGLFSEAQANYYALAKEKHEGIYVKALAYSVEHSSSTGKNIDALVFRNIYEMRPGTINP